MFLAPSAFEISWICVISLGDMDISSWTLSYQNTMILELDSRYLLVVSTSKEAGSGLDLRADEGGRVTASPRPVELSLRMGTLLLFTFLFFFLADASTYEARQGRVGGARED